MHKCGRRDKVETCGIRQINEDALCGCYFRASILLFYLVDDSVVYSLAMCSVQHTAVCNMQCWSDQWKRGLCTSRSLYNSRNKDYTKNED